MLPLRKTDQAFKSVPVSRVGSAQRLTHPGASNPLTPSSYVLSSLNPNKNIPVTLQNIRSKIKTKEQLELFEKLFIVQKVSEFERLLTELASSISSFQEENITELIENLISTNDEIVKEIEVLHHHQDLGNRIDVLEQERTDLDNEAKNILKELISCRAELKKLPRLPANKSNLKKDESMNSIDIQETLKYAMKLSKFTKAPATTANAPFQIHPNNYIWPAEDALRRGMLAVASLKADEIIKKELGEEEVKQDEEQEKPKEEKVEKEEPIARRGSFGSYSSAPKEELGQEGQQQQQAAALDLDLFDPNEEEDSD